MSPTDTGTIHQDGVEFLMREYEMLQGSRNEYTHLQEVRLNVLTTIIVGALVGVGVLAQMQDTMSQYPHLTGAIGMILAISLLLFGWITFVRMVQREMEVTVATRGMNRIRRYFVEHAPQISDFIIYPTTDQHPSFPPTGFLQGWRAQAAGLPLMAAIWNSVTVGVTTACATRAFSDDPTPWSYIGVVLFMLTLILHIRYYSQQLGNIKKHLPDILREWRHTIEVPDQPAQHNSKLVQKQPEVTRDSHKSI